MIMARPLQEFTWFGSFDECTLSARWPPTLKPSQWTWPVSLPGGTFPLASSFLHPPLLHLCWLSYGSISANLFWQNNLLSFCWKCSILSVYITQQSSTKYYRNSSLWQQPSFSATCFCSCWLIRSSSSFIVDFSALKVLIICTKNSATK